MKKAISFLLCLTLSFQAVFIYADDSVWEDDQNSVTEEIYDTDENNNPDNSDDENNNEGVIGGKSDVDYVSSDYSELFDKPLVKEDYSDQMNEPYAKYGIFLCGSIQDNGAEKYNAGTSSAGKLTEEDLRADISDNLPEIHCERILKGNYAFVAGSKNYWSVDKKETMELPAAMDSNGKFRIPAKTAEKIFDIKSKDSYVSAEYIERVTKYKVFTDARGFLLFGKNLGNSIDTSLTGSGENKYYSDFYSVSDCIGTITWDDIHPTAEQYKDFREKWVQAITYPKGSENEYADYISECIATAKDYMSHIDRNNPVNSPFDNIYIPDLYEPGYTTSHANQAAIEKAYAGIHAMARGFYVAKRSGEKADWLYELRDDIIYATMFMREKHLSNNIYPLAGTPRFTCFGITCFYSMCNAFIMMGDDLPKQVVYDTLMDFLGRNRYANSTYTNRFWLTLPHILTGIILEDDVRLNHGYRYMNQCFSEVKKGEQYPMDTQGFSEDGSFPYHGGLAYNLGYGQSFVISVSELVSVSAGTVFDLSRVYSFGNMYKWIKISWLPFIYKNMKMKMVVGREAPYASARHPVAAMLLIADKAPADIRNELMSYIKPAVAGTENQFYVHSYFPVFRSLSYPYIIENIRPILDDMNNVSGVEAAEYNKVYYNMDRIVHMRNDWLFGLSMSSQRTGKYESSNTTPVSSLTEWYISDGMIYNHNDDVQYLSAWWKGDPYYLSGTTVDSTERSTKQTMSLSESEWGRPDNSRAGGVTTGTLGAAAYENGNRYVSGLDALKSYFMFEDKVVCLGTGITGGKGNVYTVVERRQLVKESGDGNITPKKGYASEVNRVNWTLDVTEKTVNSNVGYEDIIADGKLLDVDFESADTFENPSWLWIEDRTGYVFGGNNTISVKREYYNDVPFVKIAAQHGTKPVDESYCYTILPHATAAETEEYSKNPDIEILSQTNSLHAVRQKSSGIIMANVFKASVLEGMKFETSCSVIIVPQGGDRIFYVADPTQKSDSIKIAFNNNVDVAGDFSSVDNNRVTVDVRQRPGDTYSFTVSDKSGGTSDGNIKTYSYNLKMTSGVVETLLKAYGSGKITYTIEKNGTNGTASIYDDKLLYTSSKRGFYNDIIQVRASDESGNSGIFNVVISAR